MKNGLKMFRERAGINKAELARRLGTSRQHVGRLEDETRALSVEWAKKIAPILKCTPHELMFPELARVDTNRFLNLYEIDEDQTEPQNPALAIERDFLARLLPGAEKHALRVMTIDADHYAGKVSKGDIVVLDTSVTTPSRSGLYAVEIADAIQWRYLTPTTSGKVSVQSEDQHSPAELADPEQIKLVGRARLRISTI